MGNDILELAQNAAFLDDLYEKYLADPASVDPSWRQLFESGGTELPVYAPASNGYTNGHSNGAGAAVATPATVERQQSRSGERARPHGSSSMSKTRRRGSSSGPSATPGRSRSTWDLATRSRSATWST